VIKIVGVSEVANALTTLRDQENYIYTYRIAGRAKSHAALVSQRSLRVAFHYAFARVAVPQLASPVFVMYN